MPQRLVPRNRIHLAFALTVALLFAHPPAPATTAEQPGAPHSQLPLELPKLTQPEPPKLPRPLRQPDIPAAFFGCWGGNPNGFDAVVADPGAPAFTKFNRISFCYTPHGIQVPEIDLSVERHGAFLFVLSHLGLGYMRSHVLDGKSEVYDIAGNQMLTRTTITVEITESWIFKLPTTRVRTVIDDELVALDGSDTLKVSGQQFLDAHGGRTAAAWHAAFHRW